MRGKLIGTVVILTFMSFSATAQSPDTPAPTPKQSTQPKNKVVDPSAQREQIILNILQEAHAAAEELPMEQRIAILKDICGTAAYIARPFPAGIAAIKGRKLPPVPAISTESQKQLREWSEELFRTANELTQGSYAKLDAQSTAVRAMVPVDDKRALEMLDGLESSDAQSAAQQRNFLAMYVFTEMFHKNGESVVPDLRARAQTMGDSGQYPFSAVAAIVNEIRNKDMVQSIFNDAVASYQHTNDKLNSMFGMLSLLRSEAVRQQLQPSQVHEAALAIANQLKAEIDSEQRAYKENRPQRPGIWLIAQGVLQGLKEVDPDLANTIPPLPPQQVVAPRQVIGDAPATVAAAPSPELKKTQAAFDKTSTRLMELSEDEVHSGPELRQIIERGIDEAVALLQLSTHDAKEHVPALANAMPPVTDFLQVGARTNPAMTLAAVRKVQDSEVRAKMLLVLAESLPNSNIRD